jgi:hypothetical protein
MIIISRESNANNNNNILTNYWKITPLMLLCTHTISRDNATGYYCPLIFGLFKGQAKYSGPTHLDGGF